MSFQASFSRNADEQGAREKLKEEKDFFDLVMLKKEFDINGRSISLIGEIFFPN